jgi:O-Antigen ligase
LLGITSFFLLATEVLRWDLTITTGLSAKNLVIYLLATFLALRMVVARTPITAAGPMQGAFIAQIVYAMFTWLVAALVIGYAGYDLVSSGIRLKSGLIDFYIFFLVFLFGVRSVDDGLKVIKWMLLGAIFANLATVLDTAGIVNFGYQERVDGRTQGAMGESNQYAAYIILFIPGMIAAAVGSRGAKRLAWLGGALLSCVALVMTASRGGMVGALLACVIGAYIYRDRVAYSRVAGWVLGSLAILVVILSFSQYGGLLTERVFGQTSNIDATEASSGRTEIWLNLFATMVHQPITFITGYGWDVYWSFPFRFSPHNHYFALWFNLGLVGLITGCYLLFSAISRARRASLVAEPVARPPLTAFVIGAIAVCGAVFFVELHDPWVFFWMYTGTVMRLALCAAPAPDAVPAPVPGRRVRTRMLPRDAYGWSGSQGRRPT